MSGSNEGGGFTSLADRLGTNGAQAIFAPLGGRLAPSTLPEATTPVAPPVQAVADIAPPIRAALERALAEFASELRLALARSQEWIEREARATIAAVARDVFARESAYGPPDVDALIERCLETFAAARPVALRIAAADRERVTTMVPLSIDETLAAGDFVLETPDGEIDLRIATRLRAIVESIHA